MKVEIVAAPNLRISRMKVSRYLKETNYDTLLLDFPRNLENLTRELAGGELSYESFIEEVKERQLMPEPIESWTYTAEPLLRSLPKLKSRRPELELYCYEDVNYTKTFSKIATKITQLTLRANITGKIDIEEWKDALREEVDYRWEALNEEANLICEIAGQESICTSGLDGEELKQRLIEKGCQINLVKIEESYCPTPLEILKGKLAKGDVENEEAERLVKKHLKYVKRYILTSKTRDQAYFRWVYDEFPESREKIDVEEVEYLDRILQLDNI